MGVPLPLIPQVPAVRSALPEPGGASRSLRVALVNMPWARVDAPSIQCGLLQSVVRRAGHDCDVHYLNLSLAGLLGPSVYGGLAEMRSDRLHLIGEWLFSYAAFGETTSEEAYYAEFPEVAERWAKLTGQGLDELTALRRDTAPGWLAERVDAVDWGSYDVVGFSSTFLQNTASLALGRLIKQRFPQVRLVYGGANFDGEMGSEYAAKLPWLDHVVTGEGDIALVRLLAAIADGRDEPIPGVLSGNGRDAGPERVQDHDGDAERVQDLDTLPFPDYHDYFEALRRHGPATVLADDPVRLPVEFARGCWWGEKHHCTFCGLNALGMGYRPKSPSRALEELSHLLASYPAVHLEAVDNILDMRYVSTFCEALAERRWDFHLFFEVKANLTREQLSVLKRAGVLSIQPGIESLSTNVLRLMRKGSTKLINIRLLKWARYYGVAVAWNLLTGFPGETDDDYHRQAELLPLLHHLQPPDGVGRLWLERFSPYFTDPSFPISDVRPRSAYRHIYPDALDRDKIAYFFDYRADDIGGDDAFQRLSEAAQAWRRRWKAHRPSLVYQRLPGRLSIIDRRTDQPRRAVLTGWQGAAYEACGDTARGASRVREALASEGHTVTEPEVLTFLRRCCRSGVMVEEDGHYLALALPENPGW